jgi:disulfide bond formation protein DsbB
MTDHISDAILATPPVSVGVVVIMGLSLQTWALVLTIAYTLVLFVVKLPALIKSVRTMARWCLNRKVDDVESD